MFSIQGTSVFTEADMSIGEQLEETLKNEGFGVEKHYILKSPAQLVLRFGVEKHDDNKPESLFTLD